MNPTTSGRFRVHDRRPRPDIEGGADGVGGESDEEAATAAGSDDHPEEFVLVEYADGPIDLTAPDAEDQFDPLFAIAEGYDGDLAERVASLEPGVVVDATLAWTDGSARFVDVDPVRETRFRFADGIEGMFEAAVDAWRQIRSNGEAVGSITTRSNDGEPNGALYLFADTPGGDTFADLRAGRVPIEPLVARVNDSRGDDDPREVFVLRPAGHDFVAVYVVFDRDGVLAQTVRDTYGLGPGLAAGLDAREFDESESEPNESEPSESDESEFDALDRL